MARYQSVWIAVIATILSKLDASVTPNPAIQVWNEREIGIHTAGLSAIELRDGRMALGGHSLLVFDGDNWQSFKIGTASAIRALCLDDSGRLWAGAANEIGYFEPNPDGSFEFISLKSHIPSEIPEITVWNIFKVEAGILFVTTTNLLLWDGRKFRTWPVNSPQYVKAFETKLGVLVQDRVRGVILFNRNGPELFVPQHVYANATIAFASATSTELSLLTAEKTWNFSIPEGKPPQLKNTTPNCIPDNSNYATLLRNGTIASATNTDGIHLTTLKTPTERQILRSQHTRSIMHLFESSDGALWALGRDHIARISFNTTIFSESHGIAGGQVSAIGAVAQNLVVSTDEGIFIQAGERFHRLTDTPTERAWSIRSPQERIVLAGTISGVLINNGIETFKIDNSTAAFAIEEGPEGELLCGNGDNIQIVDLNTRTARTIVPNVPDIVTSLARSSDNDFWAGTATKGVYVVNYRGETTGFARAGLAEGLPAGDYSATVFRVSGMLAVACRGQLFFRPAAGLRFQAVSNFEGTVAHISNRDLTDAVWLSLGADPAKGLANRVGKFSVENGLPIWQPLNLALHAKRGKPFPIYIARKHLVVGTPAGVAMYSIGDAVVRPKPSKPIVALETLNSARKKLRMPEFPFSELPIRFKFGSLEFGQREALRFQTRLVGVEHEWSVPTNESVLQYAGLKNGVYQFMVRSTIDGISGEPSSIVFRVNPPWWRTDLAYGGYFFGFIGVVTAAVRLRAREQRKRALLLEQLVARRTAQLLRASEAKTEFVTAMSHDVRTPINGIRGTTIELSRSHLDANQRILVKRLEACSDMLGSLVEHILDFTAIESGQTVIADSPFSPAGLLDSVRTILRASSAQSDYLIESEIDADLPGWISGDEDRIRQIMVNYVSNAVKYAGADVIKLRVRRDDNFAIFSVADRGPGISEEAQKKLFVRFSRITPAAGKEGKGLGLAGCRVIARLMNGTVGVASHVGAGAEFWLRVPMRESSPGEIFDGSRPQVICGQRALLVEDIPLSAEASRSVLEAVGLEVEVVCTGHAAIERVQLDRFDLVFLDINLPDLPGMEVASKIRSLGGEGPPIKILATTAHSTVDHKAECIRSGMTGFISKPLTPEKVRQALTRADISSLLEETGTSRASFAMLEFLSKGSPSELRRHTDRLLSGVAGEMTALSAAASKEDRDEIGRTAHRLITYARLASDQKLIELAARLELTAPVASMDSIGEQIFKIRSGIALVRSKLEDHARQAGFA